MLAVCMKSSAATHIDATIGDLGAHTACSLPQAETEYVVNKVKGKLEVLARERTQLNGEKAALLSEKEHLKAQVTDLAAAVQKMNREKVMLENTLEAEEEQARSKSSF